MGFQKENVLFLREKSNVTYLLAWELKSSVHFIPLA